MRLNKHILGLLFGTLICCFCYGQNSISDADQFYNLGNFSKALEIYQSFNNDIHLFKIAKCYQRLGRYDKALEYFKKAYELEPQNQLVTYEFAKQLYTSNEFVKAKAYFETLSTQDSLNPNFHYQLGLTKEKLKDSTAIDSYKKAYKLDDTHQKSIIKLAKHYLIKRKHKTSLAFIETGLESYPKNKSLISLKAQNFYYQKAYREAIKWFEQLLELNEQSEFIYEKLSITYQMHFDYKNALKYRLLALKYNPNDATTLYVIGKLYFELKDYVNAELYVSKALTLLDRPLDGEYFLLGKTFNGQQKYNEALKTYQKALKENPDNFFVQFAIVGTKDNYYKDINKRIEVYENFIKTYPKNPMLRFAEKRLKELKQEEFLKRD